MIAPSRGMVASVDHLIGRGEQLRWNFQSERLGCFEIYDQCELASLDHR